MLKISTVSTMIALLLSLSGCSGIVQMMPRNSGKIYSGTVQGGIRGSGTITVNIDGEVFTGPFVKASSNESFGFAQQFGSRGSSFGSMVSDGGTMLIKSILASPSGRGLRCEFTSGGNLSGGAGICVDDKSNVYDAIVTM